MKKRFGKKLFFFSIVSIVLMFAGFLSFQYFGIFEWLKCRPVRVNIKVNKNVEPAPDVVPPIWKGITPGKTTIQEAEVILKDQITERQTRAGKTIFYLYNEKHGFFLPSVLIDRNGKVEKISTVQPPPSYSKKQLVTDHGKPEGEAVSGFDYHGISVDTFIYSSKGILASFDPLTGTVLYLSYFKPMSVEKFRKSLWKGYERSIPSCIY